MSMTILIIAPHRSGTSCTAGILHYAGLFMGYKLMQPTSQNPKGFFEDLEFVNNCVSINKSKLQQKHLDKFQKLVQKRNADHELWGLKFPGLCGKAIHIAPFLDDYKVVCVDRNPLSVIKSNMAIKIKNKGQNGWDSHAECVNGLFQMVERRREFLTFTDKPVLRVKYEKLVKGNEELDKLLNFVGLTPSQKQMNLVHKFITPALKHY